MSDANKYIHRVGVDLYYKRCTRLPEDRAEYFEEIEGLPPDEDIPGIEKIDIEANATEVTNETTE